MFKRSWETRAVNYILVPVKVMDHVMEMMITRSHKRNNIYRFIEYSELDRDHNDHQVQLLNKWLIHNLDIISTTL